MYSNDPAPDIFNQTFVSKKWSCEKDVICPEPRADEIDTRCGVSYDWALLKALPTSVLNQPNQTFSAAEERRRLRGKGHAPGYSAAPLGSKDKAELGVDLNDGGNPKKTIEEVTYKNGHGTVSILTSGRDFELGYLYPTTATIKVDIWMLEAQLITLDSILRMSIISLRTCGR
jgi:hypothetical protein